MKKLLILPCLALLSACATPQEACINGVQAEIRDVRQAMINTQTNINRGYAVHISRDPYTVLTRCTDNFGQHYPCERTRYKKSEQPVAIDIASEKKKFVQLEDRLEALRLSAPQRVQQCRATYPN